MPPIDDQEGQRKLAAILAADVAGYSKLMADDERATIASLKVARAVFRERIEAHAGRLIDTTGDSVLAEFRSPVEAVECAVEIQRQLKTINEPAPDHRQMHFRIGVNLGDVIEEADGTIYGDGVNVAARLEGLAEPGGIMLADVARQTVEGKLDVGLADAGEHEVKNIAKPVRAWRVLLDGEEAGAPVAKTFRRPKVIAGLAAALAVVIGLAVWGVAVRVEVPQMVMADGTPTDDPILAMPTGPSIIVLPFENLSTESDQQYFADGITIDILSALSRFKGLFVYSKETTFALGADEAGADQAVADLGVRYVLKGSVRRSDDIIRINAHLLDNESGATVWNQNYDRSLTTENIFELQDNISQKVAAAIAGESGLLSLADAKQSSGSEQPSLTGYECVLLAYQYNRTMDPNLHMRARDCLETTVENEPKYGMAHALLSTVYGDEYAIEMNPRGDGLEAVRRALASAQKAIAIDQSDAYALFVAANAAFFLGDVASFNQFAEQAIEMNPNDPAILGSVGAFMVWSGTIERGKILMEKGFALNPHQSGWIHIAIVAHPVPWTQVCLTRRA